MRKTCKNCGHVMNDSYPICPNCGESEFIYEDNNTSNYFINGENEDSNIITEQEENYTTGNNKFINNGSKKRINIKNLFPYIIIGILVLISIFLVISSTPRYKIRSYYKGIETFNVEKIKKVMHPQYIESYEQFFDSNYFEQSIKEIFKNYQNNNIQLKKYSIENYKSYKNNTLADYTQKIESDFKIKSNIIKKVRKYNITVKYNKKGEIISENEELYLVKIGHKWYVFIKI